MFLDTHYIPLWYRFNNSFSNYILPIFLPCHEAIALYNLIVNGSDHNPFITNGNDIDFAIISVKLLYLYITQDFSL
jgi:hypothetical protein